MERWQDDEANSVEAENEMKPIQIQRVDWLYGETDELTTLQYCCPKCGFKRVPSGQTNHTFKIAHPEYDAKFCPGCGVPIEWIA